MKYETYNYLWPPRPSKAAPPGMVPFYEKTGYYAQVKKNGTCTVIFAKGDEVIFKTRHNEDHKAWTPTEELKNFFRGRSENWNVYVAELLHSKGPQIKNHLYIFDILVHDGESLVGKTLVERMEILSGELISTDTGKNSIAGFGAWYVTDNISRAQCWFKNFNQVWGSLGDLDEGLVFKKPQAKLDPCVSQQSNEAWQAKIRKPHSNFSF